ncbi:MAG: 50S ribosomal protein L29 [Candidatus Jorgensenbacteria bacterium]
MKKKELHTYREKPMPEIEKEIREARARLEALKFDLVRGKVKNIREVRAVKKTIAQLLTLREARVREGTHVS